MSLMSVNDLVHELNFQAETADIQNDIELEQLHRYVTRMFQQYCGVVPNFTVDNRGKVTILKPGL